jgi:tRNA modification GTPase
MAEAGEFSLRALANGRMNLSQAEAIRDLIDAQTVAVARQSIRQMRGELSNQLQPLKDALLNIIVILESSLEFVEDDLPDFQTEKIKSDLQVVVETLSKTASTFQAGKLLREGLRVALVGRPNVGKSSLFNALLGTDRAIVTDIAGTTRDQIHEKFTINNIPISLIDTAGLRETSDIVESIGVERSKRTMTDADLVIVLLDGSENLTAEDEAIIAQSNGLNHLIAINKADLNCQKVKDLSNSKTLKVSAKTGFGLNDLKQAIIEPFASQEIENAGFLITDSRHYDLLLRAKSEIESSSLLIDDKISEEIVLVGLHNALRCLGEVTGETTTEEMLTRIFSTFCIGK